MSGTLLLTIGTGKNGTHALDDIFHLAARPCSSLDQMIFSAHEFRPHMNLQEKAVIEGSMEPSYLTQVDGTWKIWAQAVGEQLETYPLVHHANNHLTGLVQCVRRYFPKVDLRVIIPIRENWRECAASLCLHGAYVKTKIFPYPRDPDLRREFENWHPAVKCVWLYRLKNKLADQLTQDLCRMELRTEDLDNQVSEIIQFAGAGDWVDEEKAVRLVRAKPGKGSEGKDRVFQEFARHERLIEQILTGKYEEEIPEL